jgi:biotin carboxylase
VLDRCRRQLRAFGRRPDALICHWDFPSSCLTPVLAAEYGLRAPSLEAVLRCEHKYWARLEQQKAVPECIPEFQVLDPFHPDAAHELVIDFPLWLKPVKAYSSILGFRIENWRELAVALQEMREHVGDLGRLFDECLLHAALPDEVRGIGGRHVLAESIMQGEQFACEGYVFEGEVHVHGFLDMLLGQDGREILALRYPGEMPAPLEARAIDITRRVLEQAGFDDGCFNVEFLWDAARDKLWVVEVNTRISQSHSDLFRKVDGLSHHEIAISVALGERPRFPRRRGQYRTAAKFLLNKVDDAAVTRVPDKEELRALSESLGDAIIVIDVDEGDRLSDLVHQGKYSYTVGEAWIGANSEEELMEKYRQLAGSLPLAFSDGRPLLRDGFPHMRASARTDRNDSLRQTI